MKKYIFILLIALYSILIRNSVQEDCFITGLDGIHNKLACFGNKTIPANNDSLFNVTEVYIFKSPMPIVTANFFEKLNHTQQLTLSHGNLLTVDDTSFNTLYDLEVLTLAFNKIKNISEKAFEKNFRLTVINLMSNKLEELKPNTFSTLIDLKSIDLTRNCLKSLDKQLFIDTRNLTNLDVKFNNITEISSVMFHSLPMLTVLDLSFNKIHTIPPHAFKYNYALKRLNLQGNRIKTLDFGLTHLGLEFLNLLGNPLDTSDTKTQEVLKELKQSHVRVRVRDHKIKNYDIDGKETTDDAIVFKFSPGIQLTLGIILALLIAILTVLSLLLYQAYKRQKQKLFKRYYPNVSRSKEYLHDESDNYLQLSLSDGSATFHNRDENDRTEDHEESCSCSKCLRKADNMNI